VLSLIHPAAFVAAEPKHAMYDLYILDYNLDTFSIAHEIRQGDVAGQLRLDLIPLHLLEL
jgi:hypothetical protein